jgi:hypothetical protein
MVVTVQKYNFISEWDTRLVMGVPESLHKYMLASLAQTVEVSFVLIPC